MQGHANLLRAAAGDDFDLDQADAAAVQLAKEAFERGHVLSVIECWPVVLRSMMLCIVSRPRKSVTNITAICNLCTRTTCLFCK
jgi:hypothetical protein